MLRAVALLLILSSPAMAEIVDLRASQTEGFRSIVDLRGLANMQPHQATTATAPAAPVQPAAPMPVRAAATPPAQTTQPPSSQTQSTPARVVYVGYSNNSHAERPAKPRRTFRFGRRR